MHTLIAIPLVEIGVSEQGKPWISSFEWEPEHNVSATGETRDGHSDL